MKLGDLGILKNILTVISNVPAHADCEKTYDILEGLLRESALLSRVNNADAAAALLLGNDVPGVYIRDDVTDTIINVIKSKEFFDILPDVVAAVFPRKRKRYFLHIPKTAGNSVVEAIEHGSGVPVWSSLFDHHIFYLDGVAKAAQIDYVKKHFSAPDACLWFSGHFYLKQALSSGKISFEDRGFTVVRDPLSIIVSQFNFMLTCIGDPSAGGITPDWIKWVKLEIPNWDHRVSNLTPIDYGTLLRSAYFRDFHANQICRYLSDGGGGMKEAIEWCRKVNLEIVDLPNLELFSRYQLNHAGVSSRANASDKHLKSIRNLDQDTQYYIYDHLINEDIRFYNYYKAGALI